MRDMPVKMIKDFFKLESAAGILLAIAAVVALLLENSALKPFYDALLITHIKVSVGTLEIDKPFLLWINDGFMAIFFLLVGLEVKREILQGQLSRKDQIILPGLGALGGILVPSLIYVYINFSNEVALRGWAIPAATDIAFALGILMLLGSRVPERIKICLLAIAIIDDLAAIIIIAIFYTSDLSMASIIMGLIATIALAILNLSGVKKLTPYILIGIILWICVLKSGVHATLAGVILALAIPLKSQPDSKYSPLCYLEHEIHPWVAYMILPLFVLANAGVSFSGFSLELFLQPITLGIALGLFLGKPIGVMGFTLLGIALKVCKLPKGVSYLDFFAMACITGVGFTMSLFIGTLAFVDYEHQTAVRLGVLLGSTLSGGLGYTLFRLKKKK